MDIDFEETSTATTEYGGFCVNNHTLKKRPQRRAKRLAYVTEKGGSGKTTLTNATAQILQKRGESVIIIDNDPQEGSVLWNKVQPIDEIIHTVSIKHPLREMDLAKYDNVCDYLIVDGAPGFEVDARLVGVVDVAKDIMRDPDLDPVLKRKLYQGLARELGPDLKVVAKSAELVKLVDMLIIPVKDSAQDISPACNFLRAFVEPRFSATGYPIHACLFNEIPSRETKSVQKARNTLINRDVPILDAKLSSRTAVRESSWGEEFTPIFKSEIDRIVDLIKGVF